MKCCLFFLWGPDYSEACDRVAMSAMKNLSVCGSYRHVGGAFVCFKKRLQAKVCCDLLILKFCPWNFVRLWKTTKPCFQIGSAALSSWRVKRFLLRTLNKYWGLGAWLLCLNLGNRWRRMGAPGSVTFLGRPRLLYLRIKLHNTLALPVLLYGSETWTIKASDVRRIPAAEMKYMRRRAGYTWTDYNTNAQIAKELMITPDLDKLLEYKRSWIQLVNRMPRNRLPRVMEYYSPAGRSNHGRPLKRLLVMWDWNGSTSGPTPWKIHDDDDDKN